MSTTLRILASLVVAAFTSGCLVDATGELDEETDTVSEELPLNEAKSVPQQPGTKSPLKKLTLEVETRDRAGGPAPAQQNGGIDGPPPTEPDPEPWHGGGKGKD